MNYKTQLKIMKQNQSQQDKTIEMIALKGETVVKNYDGTRRWLENGQTIEFANPRFNGVNAEFLIKNQSGQSIWFSQLSKRAMAEDLKTPMYSTIKFKGEMESRISERFMNASAFWNAVKNRQFNVKVMGVGFIVNTESLKAKMLMKNSGRPKDNNMAERAVFDHVLSCAINGNSDDCGGIIKKYPIYALTEI